MPVRSVVAFALAAFFVITLLGRKTRAESLPALDPRDSDLALESFIDGDLDAADLEVLTFHPGDERGRESAKFPGAWISLAGSRRTFDAGGDELRAMLWIGIPFDRVGEPPATPIGSEAEPLAPSSGLRGPLSGLREEQSPALGIDPSQAARAWLSPALARGCVLSAWRASGLEPGDQWISALEGRARESALLPEMRLRAERRWNDASHTTLVTTTDGTTDYQGFGADLLLEVRLTWRLDRLLFDGAEPALERTRLDRQEARSKLASRTLDALFAWARALFEVHAAVPGSREAIESGLRVAEAEATLDVITAGWFGAARRIAEARSP